jgi:methionine-rich copper-binding protein CopC
MTCFCRPGPASDPAGGPVTGCNPAVRARAIAALFPLLAAFSMASPALAHSELQQSVPAAGALLDCAPAQITLQFNAAVQLTALRLHRVDGAEVALPRRPIRESRAETIDLPPLEPGAFRAEWRIISSDGHPVGGTIPFAIARDCRP